MHVIQTDHFVNQRVTNSFAEGTKAKLININHYKFDKNDQLATYGILRGTGELLRKSKNFYYIDHGYVATSDRAFSDKGTLIKNLNGYFRIVKNDFIGFDLKKYDSDRLNKLDINFSPIRITGEYIILSEPSIHMKNFFNVHNWVEETISNIKKYTDRKLYVHNKFSEIPLEILLKRAWAFVSFQSTAGFKSMIKGVPAHFTHNKLSKINSLENIENGEISFDVFKSLSYNQWTLQEMQEGLMNKYYNIL